MLFPRKIKTWTFFCLTLALVVPGRLRAESDVLSLYFRFQSTELEEENIRQLDEFLNKNHKPGDLFLVQGFACDLGGFEVSTVIAKLRSDALRQELLQRNVPESSIHFAEQAVFVGEPRWPHRRVELRVFRNQDILQQTLAQQNELARKANEAFETAGEDGSFLPEETLEETEQEEEEKEAESDGYTPYTYIWIILIFCILFFIVWFFRRRARERKRETHQLSNEEAEAIAVLTGGAVEPLPEELPEVKAVPVSRTKKTGNTKSMIAQVQNRRKTMAAKKQSKVTPISIQGALEKGFTDKTLSQLSKAPIHALDGLSPRHSRMLEEAFGVKTVEDLARLKYFEIAKAIVVLAKYEKKT